MKTWFIIDLLSTFPYSWFIWSKHYDNVEISGNDNSDNIRGIGEYNILSNHVNNNSSFYQTCNNYSNLKYFIVFLGLINELDDSSKAYNRNGGTTASLIRMCKLLRFLRILKLWRFFKLRNFVYKVSKINWYCNYISNYLCVVWMVFL